MTLHRMVKVVLITEKVISGGVREILDQSGATGYTVVAAGGRGSRTQRSRSGVVDDFTFVRIEVIVKDKALAEEIMNRVAERYFENYSGITYVEGVEILRPEKFGL